MNSCFVKTYNSQEKGSGRQKMPCFLVQGTPSFCVFFFKRKIFLKTWEINLEL